MGRRSKIRRFTEAYRELAVRRLKECENVSELCRELGISRQLLYQWRDKFEQRQEQLEPAKANELQLREENAALKKALAEKALQLDFLKGALQKVEALRHGSTGSGAAGSTPKSGK